MQNPENGKWDREERHTQKRNTSMFSWEPHAEEWRPGGTDTW